MIESCGVCSWIVELKAGSRFLVKELSTGYVVISKWQYYRGYTLFLCKTHATELHELDLEFKNAFLQEMANVAEALYKAVKPDKLNYELLGNTEPHLHWHLVPRYKTDPLFHRPIWEVDKKIRQADNTIPDNEEIRKLRVALLKNLHSN